MPTEDEIVDKLFNYYRQPLISRWNSVPIPTNKSKSFVISDDLDIWKMAFKNAQKQGHANNQHYYPDRLLKTFGKSSYNLNCQLYPSDGEPNFTKKPIPRQIGDIYKHLYSKKGTWSPQTEGWFTGVENICWKILERQGLLLPEDIAQAILDEDNDITRFSFFFLTYVNVLRTAASNGYSLDKETGKPLDADIVFSSKGNYIEEVFMAALVMKSFTPVHYKSEIGLALNSSFVKLIPSNLKNKKDWESRSLQNSALAIPLSPKDLIFILPHNPISFLPITQLDHHFGIEWSNLREQDFHDWAFKVYNSSAILENDESGVFSNNKSKIFPALS